MVRVWHKFVLQLVFRFYLCGSVGQTHFYMACCISELCQDILTLVE